MNLLQKEAYLWPLFVLLGLLDLSVRFFGLEREGWTCNEGVMWGVPLDSRWLSLMIVGLLLSVGYLFWQSKRFEERFFFFLILLGGIVNALDRLLYGCVLDYFSWPLGLASFLPNFNLADMMLSFGLIGLLWTSLFCRRSNED